MKWLQRAKAWLGGKPAPQVRRFAAARIDRLSADWMATQSSINEELRSDLDKLRSRGRDLVNNNDYARRFRLMVQNNIVGPSGVRLQARVMDSPGRPDQLANAAIESAYKEWCAVADVTGRMHFRDLCETLVGGLPSDGEFLVRMVRGPEAGNRFNFALQAIDVDRIDTTYNVAAAAGRNAVYMGVEVNVWRRPVALHLFAGHPSDGVQSSRQRMRVPMDDLLHCFKVERPEQMRGIPWMAPGMLSLHHLGAFKLAALLAAEHGANHFGFFQTPDGQAPVGDVSSDGEQISASVPGTYDTLPPGVTFQAYDSKYPEQNFGPFVKTTLQRIASGWGVAYHVLANDLEGVSFSSIRSGVLAERDRWTAEQEWFISSFMERVYTEFLRQALFAGAITMPNGTPLPSTKYFKFLRHEWQPRRWEWVDPLKDAQANVLKVQAGMTSPQALAAAAGEDFEDVIQSIAVANQQAAALKVALPAYDSDKQQRPQQTPQQTEPATE